MIEKKIFKNVVKGKNFITPEIIKYGNTGRHIYELSEGTDFKHNPIYGITVITLEGDKWKHNTDLGKCCDSLNEATCYVKQLKNL